MGVRCQFLAASLETRAWPLTRSKTPNLALSRPRICLQSLDATDGDLTGALAGVYSVALHVISQWVKLSQPFAWKWPIRSNTQSDDFILCLKLCWCNGTGMKLLYDSVCSLVYMMRCVWQHAVTISPLPRGIRILPYVHVSVDNRYHSVIFTLGSMDLPSKQTES